MKNFRIFFVCIFFRSRWTSFSQGSEKVEMADVLRQDGKIYTVVIRTCCDTYSNDYSSDKS